MGVALSRGELLAVADCVTVMEEEGDLVKDVDSVAARVAVTEPVAEAGLVAQPVAVDESEAAKEKVPAIEGELVALGEPDSVALPVTERTVEGDTVEECNTATVTLGDSEGDKVAEYEAEPVGDAAALKLPVAEGEGLGVKEPDTAGEPLPGSVEDPLSAPLRLPE